jgi:hypothetical protein
MLSQLQTLASPPPHPGFKDRTMTRCCPDCATAQELVLNPLDLLASFCQAVSSPSRPNAALGERMDVGEKAEILAALERGRQAFFDALNGVSEDLAAKRPGPGRWSALECAGHVASVPVANQAREAAILARGTDRTRPGVSPEAVRPAGRFSTLADAVRHLLASRAGTVRFVENCTFDLRSSLTRHPLLVPVNAHETLLLMAVHPSRHAKQIDEIKAAAR